jgi:hypothetical protein
MIAFATLFLGLVLGPQRIELVVEGAPAAVQLVLDGREVASLSKPPWAAEVDLGSSLAPHVLEAVARDAQGVVGGSARQWINLPRAAAEAALVLEGQAGAMPRRARLVWHHIAYAHAEAVLATLDGVPLAVEPGGAIALPAYDPNQVHLLEAELRFADGSHYATELAFGGPGGTSMNTELTGVVVRASGPGRPTVEAVAGRLRDKGEPLRVVAVEKAPARVVMVLEESARGPLRELAMRGGLPVTSHTALQEGDEVRFLFPRAELVPRKDVPARLFEMTQAFTRRDGTFGYLLTRVRAPQPGRYQRLTDAIAVAAVEAAAGSRPRAVVLVLGPQPKDESAYRVAEVLRFLDALHVPLLVWSTGRPSGGTVSEDRLPLALSSPWGQARHIGAVGRLLRAVEGLRDVLEGQSIVWVEGAHLPQRIGLDGQSGLSLVGVQP